MRKPRGKAQVRIRADLALRWARTADILVLVLWDVESSVGWYSIPELADLHSELAEKGRRNISLTILSKNLFDADAARHIAWEGRLAHLARFVRNFRRLQEEEAQIEPGEHRWADEAISEAVVDMMVDLGILEKVTVKRREVVPSREFRKFFLDMARDTRGAQPASAEEIDEYFKEISFASYFMWISDVIGCAISASLMSEMVPIVDYFFNPESPRGSLGHLSYGRRSI